MTRRDDFGNGPVHFARSRTVSIRTSRVAVMQSMDARHPDDVRASRLEEALLRSSFVGRACNPQPNRLARNRTVVPRSLSNPEARLTRDPRIHTLDHPTRLLNLRLLQQPQLVCGTEEREAEKVVVCVGHGWEARAELVFVGADEGVHARL